MNSTLGPKAGGVLAVLLGIGAIVYTWHLVLTEGRFFVIVCVMGPPLVLTGLAMLALPARLLFQKKEVTNGDTTMVVFDYQKFSPLGTAFLAVGILAGAGQFLYLKFGWF